MRKDVEELWKFLTPPVEGAGFELVELEWSRDQGGWVLRMYIDRRSSHDAADQGSVTFDDCERVSRDVSATLDVADIITHAYRLEVSSPGIDRPLRRVEDFRRFVGQRVKIRTNDAVEGRRNFSGTILGTHEGVVDVECDGQSYQIRVDVIARANLVPDWDAEFRRAGGQSHRSAS
jgi:ribosome maturation factor RimP